MEEDQNHLDVAELEELEDSFIGVGDSSSSASSTAASSTAASSVIKQLGGTAGGMPRQSLMPRQRRHKIMP